MIGSLVRLSTWPARRVGVLLLDTILGPPDQFDYVSTTSPRTPAPHNF